MLYFKKKNVFMCLVVFLKMFQKIFFSVWLCSWKYYKKHIFYLLLTFSRLPNEYISFISQYRNTNKIQKKIIKSGRIFSIAKQIYNIIHSSIQKHKQNPEKKISNPVKLREEGREREMTRFDEGLRSAQRRDRDQRGARLWVVLSLFLSPFARLWAPLFAHLSSGSDLKVK